MTTPRSYRLAAARNRDLVSDLGLVGYTVRAVVNTSENGKATGRNSEWRRQINTRYIRRDPQRSVGNAWNCLRIGLRKVALHGHAPLIHDGAGDNRS